jgi:hypothetical protein
VIQPPPGFAGQLAEIIYQGSYAPVPEVAVAAAIALLAGICGRAYRTHTDKDLALYMILVARSGIGKDGIHSGIPKLLHAANSINADRFVRKTDFVSGPALHKELLRAPGFLNLQGEFGRKLKGMADSRNAPMQALRTVMTDAYAKEFLEGKGYSDAAESLGGVTWPALSFLGETTPGTFLESLTDDMMEDGFMSRFLTIWHDGIRLPPNEEHAIRLTTEQAAYWKALVQHAVAYQLPINMPPPKQVGFKDQDAYDKLKRFELDCIDLINGSSEEADRQTYNRAHLKALKLAGLLAVADSYAQPQIDICHGAWALNLVRADMNAFRRRKAAGLVGNSDHAREHLVRSWLEDYLVRGAPDGYRIPSTMRLAGIVPRVYLQRRTSGVAAFGNHRNGPTAALDQTIKSLIECGNLADAAKDRVAEQFRYSGRCFRVLSVS